MEANLLEQKGREEAMRMQDSQHATNSSGKRGRGQNAGQKLWLPERSNGLCRGGLHVSAVTVVSAMHQ